MRWLILALIILPVEVYAHHWIGFISCGFSAVDLDDKAVRTIVAPNFGRVFIKITSINYVRGYKQGINDLGISCSSIEVNSGEILHVVGSLDNVLNRLHQQYLLHQMGYR